MNQFESLSNPPPLIIHPQEIMPSCYPQFIKPDTVCENQQKIAVSFISKLEYNSLQQAQTDQVLLYYKDYCRLYYANLFYSIQVLLKDIFS